MIIAVMGEEWARRRTMVNNRLAEWGYPVPLMMVYGLSEAGYLEQVRDASGRRQLDPATNRLMTVQRPWEEAAHWEWLLENAPLLPEDGEGAEEEVSDDQVQ